MGAAYVESGLVCTKEDGSQLHPAFVTKQMQKIAQDAGLPQNRLHDLRHGMASMHLAAGASMELVSKLVGHSSRALTADTYSHLMPGVGRSAAEAIEGLVPRGADGGGLTCAHERRWAFFRGGERPGRTLCAARDSNPEPADQESSGPWLWE